MSIKDNLLALLTMYDVKQAYLARIADVDRSTVSRWFTGSTEPETKNLQAIADYFNLKLDDLRSDSHGLAAQQKGSSIPDGFVPINPVPTVSIPVVGVVHAGQPIDYEEVDYLIDVPQSIIHHEDGYYGCVVEGDCMDKVYPEGCFVVVDTHKEPRDGSIGAFEIDGYQVVMRRVHRGANTLILSPESFNPEHRDIIITEDSDQIVQAIGTVVWFQAREELA